ncbi:MAG: hypothetical protein JW839_21700, partial [Candidatus Lokiarchaeota archaeon]|nr:hypothetical protein [Candidatus Lokiarchaeota archaeon]
LIFYIVLASVYYLLQFVKLGGTAEAAGLMVVSALFDLFVAFFFGLLIFGLLGISCAKLFFLVQAALSRNRKPTEKYIMLKTSGTVTGWLLIKRAFLLYAISISLTLTTLQIFNFLDPSLLVNQNTFTLLYTSFVFIFAAGLTLIVPPLWYLDDVNLMYFTESEGVKYLNPVGQSVLPALKGLGSINIVIAYVVFVVTRFQGASLDTMFDPLLTLFMPIAFILGFDTISDLGRKKVRAWLVKKGIQSFDELRIELVKGAGEYKLKANEGTPGPGKRTQEKKEPSGKQDAE